MHRFGVVLLGLLACSKSEPSKSEPSKSEPSKSEPSKNEPSNSEPSKSEPSKSEPSKSEPPKSRPKVGFDCYRTPTAKAGVRECASRAGGPLPNCDTSTCFDQDHASCWCIGNDLAHFCGCSATAAECKTWRAKGQKMLRDEGVRTELQLDPDDDLRISECVTMAPDDRRLVFIP